MTARRRHPQPTITVRRERGRIIVTRPGSPPWNFQPDDIEGALSLARVAARLFGARLDVQIVEEGR